MIKQELIESFRVVVYNIKFVLLYFFTNFLFALLLSIPVFQSLYQNLANSLLSYKLAASSDFLWYLQYRNIFASELDKLPTSIIVAAVLYILIQTFFTGGILTIFNLPKKNDIIDFFYGGVRFWFRFIKITLLSLFLIAISFLINDLLGSLISWAYSNYDYVLGDFILRSTRYSILIFLIGTVILISDFTKADLIFKDESKVLASLKRALIFIRKNFILTFSVFLIFSVISIGIAIIYNIVGNYISRSPYVYIIITFTLQQILIILRFGIKMYLSATELNLYKAISVDTITVKAKEEKIILE